MKNNILKLAFLSFLSFLLLAACSSETSLDPSERLLGKWELVDIEYAGMTYRFLDDGTFMASFESRSIAGKWSILGDGALKMDFTSALGGTDVYLGEMEFDGNQLIITDKDDGEIAVFNRLE